MIELLAGQTPVRVEVDHHGLARGSGSGHGGIGIGLERELGRGLLGHREDPAGGKEQDRDGSLRDGEAAHARPALLEEEEPHAPGEQRQRDADLVEARRQERAEEVHRERDEREAEDAAHSRHPLARTRERLEAARRRAENQIGKAEAHREREEEAEAERRRALCRDVGQERQDERADAGRRHEPHEESHRQSADGAGFRPGAVRNEVRDANLEEPEHRERERDDDGRDREENDRFLQPRAEK